MATGVTYLEMADAIKDYYGAGSDAWMKFTTGSLQGEELINVVKQVPGASVTVSNSGRVLGYEYSNPFAATQSAVANVNSNLATPTYGGTTSFNARVNGNYHIDDLTHTGQFKSGATKVSTGTKVSTVVGKVGTALAAVTAGCFLGAKIDSALYNVGNFFDLNPPESLNPETWDDLATTEAGKSVLRMLFDIGDDGATTAYMSEDMIAYMYQYWYAQGLWATGATSVHVDDTTAVSGGRTYTLLAQPVHVSPTFTGQAKYNQDPSPQVHKADIIGNSSVVIVIAVKTSNQIMWRFMSKNPFSISTTLNSGANSPTTLNSSNYTVNVDGHNYTVYYVETNTYYDNFYEGSGIGNTITATATSLNNLINPFDMIMYYYMTLFQSTITQTNPIDGAGRDPNAQEQVDPSQIDTSQPILPQLQQQLPNTFSNPIKEKVPQPDGTNREITYYPVPWPNLENPSQPVSGTPTQANPIVTPTNPTDETDPLRDVITNPNPQTDTSTPGDPATPPDTGTGSTPTVVPPTGQASSMWTVYNPTQAQLDAFGSWLWSSNFVDQIKKLFNDPMQAIIGVHKVFATPSTGGQVNIKCGYIDSGCPAAEVTSQYTTIDCGTVNVREYYGNVFDYAPFTEISLYLPFIGIVKLDVADVMRSSVSVKYHVDVITGACLADVKVSRDGENAVLYQYAGSAIVSYPISSGSYASAVTGVLSLAAGVAGTVVTGGAAAPALIGGALGLTHLHTNVEHSGGFAGSPGAMGGKKPYLIISRAQENLPNNFEHYEGKPASKTVKLGDCSGFTKVKSINIKGVPATSGELEQIVTLLKSGVIV